MKKLKCELRWICIFIIVYFFISKQHVNEFKQCDMTSWDLLSLKDSNEWLHLVEECEKPDLHFLPSFMKLFEDNMNGEAMLLVSYNISKENYVLYPFFKRRINDIGIFSSLSQEYFDIVSPWYYGGLLNRSNENSQDMIQNFLKNFQECVKKNKIITEFTKIHPLLNLSKDYARIAGGVFQYDVSYINLNQSGEIIWNNMKDTHKRNIRSAKKKGLEVEFSTNDNSLKSFHNLYEETMQRLQAEDFYFFSYNFLKNLKTSFEQNFVIATTRYQDKPIAQAIFLYKYGIFYYWLGASNIDFRNLHPNHLLFNESILWAKKYNNNIFYFGGGRAESLRKFKESFGSSKKDLFIISKVHDETVYSNLNKIKQESQSTIKNSSYFPAYRA